MTLLTDLDEINERVNKIWAVVFKNSNAVLRQSAIYGFYCIQEVPNPNIHAMLLNMHVFSSVMDIIISHGIDIGLEYDQTRMILNAKEQLTKMERVAAALKANNRVDYDNAIQELELQAAF